MTWILPLQFLYFPALLFVCLKLFLSTSSVPFVTKATQRRTSPLKAVPTTSKVNLPSPANYLHTHTPTHITYIHRPPFVTCQIFPLVSLPRPERSTHESHANTTHPLSHLPSALHLTLASELDPRLSFHSIRLRSTVLPLCPGALWYWLLREEESYPNPNYND